jgi:hypothetical protein
MKTKNKFFNIILILLLFSFFTNWSIEAKEKEGKKGIKTQTKYNTLAKTSIDDPGGKKGDAYRMFINNINMPLNRRGTMGNVLLPDFDGVERDGGRFDGTVFLWAGGFYISGISNDTMWAIGNAAASRDEHFYNGTYAGGGQTDPRAVVYVLRAKDGDFHSSWDDWKDAVALGAEFYDGDGDGEYNPVDLNENGKWDPDEDRPDLLGDETAWCAYHDAMPASLRTGYENVVPQGIEIKQTVFGFASKGSLGNILFLRYKIFNTGMVADVMDSVYFGVWADPDVGDVTSDLVGCDTTLNAGFVYDSDIDPEYNNSPCFLIDFFQGPVGYEPGETFVDDNANGIYDEGETALDTAFEIRGLVRGVKEFPGARNLGLSSFTHYIQGNDLLGDPLNETEARYYNLGLNRGGDLFDPCDWGFGEVHGSVNCEDVDPYFLYSGDPVADEGWICVRHDDQRQMSNTGPFQLKVGEPIEIVVAYVVGRAPTSLASVDEAKKISNFAQFIYDNNFKIAPPPPVPEVAIKTEENAIELFWDTHEQVNFSELALDAVGDVVYDVKFEGYEVFMYNSNSTAEEENGKNNVIRIASYDLANDIGDVLSEGGGTGEREIIYSKGIQLDPEIFGDPERGRIKLRITDDPFTGDPLIKGRPYYIGISTYGLNHHVLTRVDSGLGLSETFYLPGSEDITSTATIPSILGDGPGIIPGSNLNLPFRSGVAAEHNAGGSTAEITYAVINRDAVQPHEYEISFIKDSLSSFYNLLWRVTDKSTGAIVVDSSSAFEQQNPEFVADGVQPYIEWIEPALLDAEFEGSGDPWFTDTSSVAGPLYVGGDVDTSLFAQLIKAKKSTAISADKMRRVEIRFGEPSMAYRYLKKATSTRYLYPDPEDASLGSGFVEVPFSAWVKDFEYGEEYQLAVGFTESSSNDNSVGVPDGIWNPYSNLRFSREYIIVFSTPYDPSGSNVAYTGTFTGSGSAKFADIGNGYRIDASDPRVTDEIAAVGKSPFFDAMYIVGLESKDSTDNFNPTGTYIVNTAHPLTVMDTYTYTPALDLSAQEEQDNFDKVNVYPNPLYGFNSLTSFGGRADEPYVTFTNLPGEVTIKIYSLAGVLLRTLRSEDKSSLTSPFCEWNLQNEDGLRVASGMYLAIVSSPGLGDKVLKFGIITPQKQIQRF